MRLKLNLHLNTVPYIKSDENIQMDNIPAIPDIARRFLLLYKQEKIEEQDILLLQTDYPEFFSSLLSVINSDHFNLTTKVKSVFQAIELSGLERICNLMLCLVMYRAFNRVKTLPLAS